MNIWSKILSKLTIITVALCLVTPCANAGSNLINGTIGDYGSWTTPENIGTIRENIAEDLTSIQEPFQHQLVNDYVPIEAKLGLTFMKAMSKLGNILNHTLIPFITIFIILGYAFWLAIESYIMMTTDSNVKKFAETAVKNGGMVVIWLLIINADITYIFSLIMSGVVDVGHELSKVILNALPSVQLPDTCSAIATYITEKTDSNTQQLLIDNQVATNIMCMATKMSSLFYTAVNVGFRWMIAGVTTHPNVLTFLAGAAFVVLFIINIWKFALMAFGVIADLFFVVLLLPFTAVAETLGTYKFSKSIIVDKLWTGIFKDMFNSQTLSSQIGRIISTTVYFVALSIVIVLCTELLTPILEETGDTIPTIADMGFLTVLLTGCLLLYMANQADKLAKEWGGKINDSIGQKTGQDIINLSKKAWGKGKDLYKIIRHK